MSAVRTLLRTVALATVLAATPQPPAVAATLVNGSFEPSSAVPLYLALPSGSTAIPGWTTTDSGVEWFQPAPYGSGPAYSGLYVVDLANYVYSAGGIQQTFATTPGEVITIDFQLGTLLAAGRDGTCQIVVDADGQTQTFSHATTSSSMNWKPCAFTFTADDASATLRLRCLQNANVHFANVDGLGARPPVVPADGSTWGRIKSLYR